MIVELLGLLAIGLIAGAVARLFVRTGARLGCLGTILLGVLGSYVGGSLGAFLFDEQLDLRRSSTILGAIAGSIVALLVLRVAVTARRR